MTDNVVSIEQAKAKRKRKRAPGQAIPTGRGNPTGKGSRGKYAKPTNQQLPAVPKSKGGRPKGSGYQPTDDERAWVEHLVAIGYPSEVIARHLFKDRSQPAGLKMLERHFRYELSNGKDIVDARVAGRLYAQAMAGDGANQRFWMRTRRGWREGIEVSGVINFNVTSDDAALL